MNAFQKKLSKLVRQVKYKNYKCFCEEKIALVKPSHGKMYLDICLQTHNLIYYALRCTTKLHCNTELHCTELHFIDCTVLNCTVMHCTAALHCTVPQCTVWEGWGRRWVRVSRFCCYSVCCHLLSCLNREHGQEKIETVHSPYTHPKHSTMALCF